MAQERRSVQRVAGDTIGPVAVEIGAPGIRMPAAVRDISVCGIGLLAAHPFPPGTTVTIRRRGTSVNLQAEVRQATALPDTTWLIGCKLAASLTVDDVLALG